MRVYLLIGGGSMSRPFTEVTGTITGNELHFRCPGCATPYAWFVDQLASLPDQSLADYCDQCGHGFRVGLGPNRPVAAQVPAPSAASMPTPPDVAAAVMGRYA